MELIRWWDEVLREVHRCVSGTDWLSDQTISLPTQSNSIFYKQGKDQLQSFYKISNWKEVNQIFQLHWSWLSVIGRYWQWLGWSWLVGLACQWAVSSEQWTVSRRSRRSRAELNTACRRAAVHCSVQCGAVALDTSVLATLIHLTWRRRVPTNNSVIDRLITGPSLDITKWVLSTVGW